EAAAAVDVRVAGVVGGGAQAHLPGDQVVPGLPGGQVAGARGVRAGGGAVLEHGTGEGGQVVAAGAHALPGAGDPGVVDVAHQPGAGVGGEAFGGVGGSGGAELRPLGRVLLRHGHALRLPGPAQPGDHVPPPDLVPAPQTGDADHDAD